MVACKKTNEQHETYNNTTPDEGNRASSSSTWNNQSDKEAIIISNTTGIEHFSVMNKIHYPEVSDHTETCVVLHNESSTVVHQTVNNFDLISATVVDTSNDASLVQMTRQANMAINCVQDPIQMVNTCFDRASHDHNTIDGPIHDEKLQL